MQVVSFWPSTAQGPQADDAPGLAGRGVSGGGGGGGVRRRRCRALRGSLEGVQTRALVPCRPAAPRALTGPLVPRACAFAPTTPLLSDSTLETAPPSRDGARGRHPRARPGEGTTCEGRARKGGHGRGRSVRGNGRA